MSLDKSKRSQSMDELRGVAGKIPLAAPQRAWERRNGRRPAGAAGIRPALRRPCPAHAAGVMACAGGRTSRLSPMHVPNARKTNLLAGSLGRYGKNRRFPQTRRGAGLLRPASRRRRAADDAHARRPDADQVPRPGRKRSWRGYITEVLTQSQINGCCARGNDLDFSYVTGGGRTLPRQRVPQGNRASARRFVRHSDHHAEHRSAGAAAYRASKLCDYHQGMILVTGRDRHRQVDDARLHDRPSERHPLGEHHQPRGSDRVRPPQQVKPGDPAGARHPPAVLCRGRARSHARGSGRDPGRRNARRGDDFDGDDRRRDRPSRARHAAHDQRHQDAGSHHRRPAHRGARTDQELSGGEPDRRHHPDPGKEPGPARDGAPSAK